MNRIDFNYSNSFVKEYEIQHMKPLVHTCHELLHNRSGAGGEFTGWIDLPKNYDVEEFERIKDSANNIRKVQIYLL